MLTPGKKSKTILAIKSYCKKYITNYTDLDESATRLMVNTFLTDVLEYKMIDEVKTEYMIRGTYADYMIQTGGSRHFLVEVKAMGIELSEKHLRQAINYGANEGVEWAMLTNGSHFELHKIIFGKPIESKKVFSFNLATDGFNIKDSIELIQYLHRDVVNKKGLDLLWKRSEALDPKKISGYIYSTSIMNIVKRQLKNDYKISFSNEEISEAFSRVMKEKIEAVKPRAQKKNKTIKKSIELPGLQQLQPRQIQQAE